VHTTDTDNITCEDDGISELGGIEKFSNIVALTLRGNEISDLSPLGHMPKLRGLILDGNNFSDFSAIANLRQLRLLRAENVAELEDISALLYMQNLRFVHLSGAGFDQQISCDHLDTLDARMEELDRPDICRVSNPAGQSDRPESDFDDDGRADVVLEFDCGNGSHLWAPAFSELAGERFRIRTEVLQAVDETVFPADKAVGVADATGDGLADVLVQLTDTADRVRFRVFPSDGTSLGAGINGPTLAAGNDARAIGFADIDADGFADILYQEQIAGTINYHVAYGTGDGFTSSGVPVYRFVNSAGRATIVALEDVNGDGAADLVYDRVVGDTHCFFVRVSQGGVLEPQGSPRACASSTADTTCAVGVADLTGDGRSELVIQSTYGGVSQWQYFTLVQGASGCIDS
jgi:hypothetical protein